MSHPLGMFDWVPIINLPDRADRRRAMTREVERIGGFDGGRVTFFAGTRPADRGPFPSVGAHGCFMSHLGVLRTARDRGVERLLILEDDLNFSDDFAARVGDRLARLAASDWDMFYGAYDLPQGGALTDAGAAPADLHIQTASFLAMRRPTVTALVSFLEEMLGRPPGSPEFGPMHVDGAYTVFRRLNPGVRTYAAAPPLGYQRSSRSDISDTTPFFDRVPLLRDLADLGRRARAAARGR